MKWRKYTVNTTTEAEDLVSLMLNELGVEGVQIENNVPLTESDTKGMFIDILPELPEDDGTSRVSFFLREEDCPCDDAAGNEAVCDDEDCNGTECNDAVCNDAVCNGAVYEDSDVMNAASDPSVDASYTIDDRIWTAKEIERLLCDIRAGLDEMSAYTDIGSGKIEAGETEDTDWRDNWKQFFKPLRLGGFLIKPSWSEIPAEYINETENGSLSLIEIDPGTAFGTGSHETTQLCMSMIEKYLRSGDKVLDIGTGSGILGIAALKKGAAGVFATELDEACVSAVSDNLEMNRIKEGSFVLRTANILTDEAVREEAGYERYDMVIANILAPVIVLLSAPGNADRFLRKGGIFISSGIIDTKEQDVLNALKANPAFDILEVRHQGEWVGITAVKKQF